MLNDQQGASAVRGKLLRCLNPLSMGPLEDGQGWLKKTSIVHFSTTDLSSL